LAKKTSDKGQLTQVKGSGNGRIVKVMLKTSPSQPVQHRLKLPLQSTNCRYTCRKVFVP
jgi:hypothetical protein